MNSWVYDFEVFCADWLVDFKNRETKQHFTFVNDNQGVRDFLNQEDVYFGFNSKGYDQYIMKAVCNDFTAEEIKALNDWIISGEQGWLYPPLKDCYLKFNNVDIKDDMQMGMSLKSIEGHLGKPIVESSVSFDIDRELTECEMAEVIKYCRYDVDMTDELIDLRKDYLNTKLNLGKRANIPPEKALSCTNAKITALMLGAKRKEWSDGRAYVYPKEVDVSLIPQEVLDFFNTIWDKSIPDDELFKTSCEIELGGMPTKYAWGGVHGSLTSYQEQTTDTRVIQNRDVSSLYPSLIEEYGYLSRNVPSADIYINMKHERIAAKHKGDKQTANDLKLPLNTVSGAQENEYNDLYDPLPTRSLRISGQLFLTMLAVKLLQECKTIKLLNFNTDGLMYSIDRYELPLVDKISDEWGKATRFELETDNIEKVFIKDVNNLLFVDNHGKVKKIGAYLKYGISQIGAWSVNNNAVIVKKAVEQYFVNNTPLEDTINNCDDIFEFQMIAKAGSKYSSCYQLVNNEKVECQKANRVYATTDTKLGTLYKVHGESGQINKIESIPEHCLIDNENKLNIQDIDKSWYIKLAQKRLNDFLGIAPEKKTRRKTKMATATKTENVYQKLLKARLMFSQEDIKKTGKNMHLSFKYFELEDIVPIANRIFSELGIIPVVTFEKFEERNLAIMKVVNAENPTEIIVFELPFTPLTPITSNTGKQATNEMQALGSSVTYIRRYLYMIALDICESDSIDSNLGSPTIVPTAQPQSAPTHTAPATPVQRQEVKQELTAPTENATTLQIKGLKTVLKKLKDADPSKEEMIGKIAIDTQGFTVISKSDCETLITKISAMLEGGNQ